MGSERGKPQNPLQLPSLNESYQFVVALVLIGGFLVFYYMAFMHDPNLEAVKTVSATYGTILAAIVGYYFGQKPVHTLTNQIREAEGQAQNAKQGFAESVNLNDEDKKVIENLKEIVRLKDEYIDKLMKEKGEA